MNSRTRVADDKPPAAISLGNREAYVRLSAYCAYQERCRTEIMEKMEHYGLAHSQKQALMNQLEEDNFYNEQRFAKAYAGGKFRLLGWGKLKIRQGLKARGIDSSEINKAIHEEISDESYLETLSTFLNKKANSLSKEKPFLKKQKLVSYALGKGYELDIVLDVVNGMEM